MKGEEKAACCSPSPTLLLDIVVLALCSQPGRCLGICLQFFRQLEKSPVTAGRPKNVGIRLGVSPVLLTQIMFTESRQKARNVFDPRKRLGSGKQLLNK